MVNNGVRTQFAETQGILLFLCLQILTKPHCDKTSYFFRCEISQNNAFDYI